MSWESIDFADIKQLLDTNENTRLLDVREEDEFITGHPKQAELFPLDEISDETAELAIPDKASPVIVYCRTGARSREAAEKLCALGYERVYDAGSMAGWPYGTV